MLTTTQIFYFKFSLIFRARNHPYGHSAKSALLNKRDPRLFPRKILKSLVGRVNEPLLEVPMLEKMSKTPPMGTMITPPTSPVILSGISMQKSSEIPDDILNFPYPEGTIKSPEVNFMINKDCIQCAEYRSKIDELEIKSDEVKNAIKTINSDIDQFEIESKEKFEIEMTIQNSGNSVETSSDDDDEEITKLTNEIVGIENIDLISENKKFKQEAEDLKKELTNMKFNAQLELQIKSQHIKDLEDSKSQKENKRLRQENEDLKNELSNLKFNSEKEIQKQSLRIKELEGQEDNLKKELSNLKSNDQIKSKYIKELEGQDDPREIQKLNLEVDNLKKELSNLKSNDQIKSKHIKELEDKNG